MTNDLEFERTQQLYCSLLECNSAITQVQNPTQLFQKICHLVLNISDINMSWIGVLDEMSNKIKPIVFEGLGVEYVEKISIKIDPDNKLSYGAIGTAYRENRTYVCDNFQNDINTKPCHELAYEFGWNSSASFPIHTDKKVVAVLTIYSKKTAAFDKHTTTLIENLILNIDNTLTRFKHEEAHKQSDIALQESHDLLMKIIDSVPSRIFWKDKNLTYLGCNTAFAKDAGKTSPAEIIGKNDHQMTWKDQAELYNKDDREIINGQKAKLGFEEPQTTPDGKTIWLRTSKVPLYNIHNETIGILGTYDDITEQKNAQNSLKESQQYLHTIFDNEPGCVKVIDKYGKLVDMNRAGLAMLEAGSLKKAQSRDIVDFILPEWRSRFIEMHKSVMQGNSETLEFQVKGFHGTIRWLETHAAPLYDDNGEVYALLGITIDITEKKESEERILFMANYDSLTGLPNRLKLKERLNYTLTLAKRNGWKFALMFLDVDNFKYINDTLGHDIGDELLKSLAERIEHAIREEDMLARFGGDEFIVLLPSTDAAEAQAVAQKIINIVSEPLSINKHKITTTVSVGIVIYPDDGADQESLYKNADIAMYRAKQNGRNNFSFFTQEMQEKANRTSKLSSDLHYALAREELYLVYQPQISLKSEKIIGFEALLRWKHHSLGDISPDEFIPICESNGLIFSIGEWVVETAIKQLNSWHEVGMDTLSVAVNLSAVQFKNLSLPDMIQKKLKDVGVSDKYLELELTESATMGNPQEAILMMNKLNSIGVKMAIDDFGTGYSSLSYLKKFNVYKLKIDRIFIQDIGADVESHVIVNAIIKMAQTLGLRTIAEGVETLEQLEYLKEKGCDEVQGYYCYRPLEVKDFEEIFLKKKNKL